MQAPTISDMSITDEHVVVDPKTTVGMVSERLSRSPDDAILVKDKSGNVAGVVTSKDIFKALGEGKSVVKLRLEKIMRTNVLTTEANTPLADALTLISKQGPDAIVIMNGPNFAGYFSPDDYRSASRRIEAHQSMASRLKQSKSALTEAASEVEETDPDQEKMDLINLLLGDNEEEEEEEISSGLF